MDQPLENRLGGETSPYLLQHADNPVWWQPWDADALRVARELDRPILLSVGYSACHWCHVMAHESFEDETIAALMNAHFVNIKVDREERPDLDRIYQTAHYLLTQNQGGWPLTMFLTPDEQLPFFGGTYFPNRPRHNLPGFGELLPRVAQAYRERGDDIRAQNQQLLAALHDIQRPGPTEADSLGPQPLTAAREQSARAFDGSLGGFGRAPKFPHPSSLERLLRDAARSGGGANHPAAHMAVFSLDRMARGGIYDHLGGGFCRYSVDAHWMIPHFEKMLYDNGPLLGLYAQAWQLGHNPLFDRVVHETAEWVAREMTAPGGGFYSSLDADSEGEEGRFYVWDSAEVRSVLGDDYECFARRYGLNRDPNFEGQWHLYLCAAFEEIANVVNLPAAEVEQRVERARQKLFELRARRPRPGRDDKVLTAWNALMIKGLAVAGRVFARDDYVDRAERALDFIHATMWRDGRLLATAKDGRAHLNAYLDDYAFLIDAILALLEARWRDGDLGFAIELADVLLDQFEDSADGGFYFTGSNHEDLVVRTRPFSDDALPAGNGIAACALARLGHLVGDSRYLEAAERTLRAAAEGLTHAASGHNAVLFALEEFLEPPRFLVVRAEPEDATALRTHLSAAYRPTLVALVIPPAVENLPGLLSQQSAEGRFRAYLCEGTVCRAPCDSEQAAIEQLSG